MEAFDDEYDEILDQLINEENEFIDRTRTFKGIETLEDIYDVLDDYENVLFPDLIEPESIFVFNVTYVINGSYRTLHLDGLTLEGFKTELETFNQRIEIYNEREEDLFERFVELKIRQRNRGYGNGQEMYLTTIEDDQLYFKCFTKTRKRCIAISVIKHEELNLRIKSAGKLHDHPLLVSIRNKKLIHQDEIIRECERFYNKEIIIIQPSTKINYEDKRNKIVLVVYNNHVGYVTKDYPYINTKKQVEEVKETENEEVIEDVIEDKEVIKKEEDSDEDEVVEEDDEENYHDEDGEPHKKLHGLFFWDLEFEWEKNGDTYVSKEPNLVCMIGFIRTKTGFVTKRFTKRNISLMMSLLINMANIGKVLVYSVNGSKVEHQQALREIIKNYFRNRKQEYSVVNTLGSRIKTLRFGKNLRFYDTVLLLPMSLSDMALNFNTTSEKGHKEWETLPLTKKIWRNERWEHEIDKDEWYRNKKWDYKNKHDVAYCMNDCVITMEALIKYNNSLKNKVMCISYEAPNGDTWVLGNSSISSIGKQTLLKLYPEGLNCNATKSLFQESYIGGRCEIFYHGYLLSNEERKLVSIDINSSYPYQATKDLPYSLIRVLDTIPVFNKNHCWGSYCWISYRKNYDIPPLGIKRGGNLYFPNLDEPTLIFLWDFEYYGLRKNLIIHDVSKTFVFSRVSFKGLFENWYEMKKNAPNKVIKTVAKQLLNGTTGGLGLKQVQPVRALTKDVEKTIQKLNLQTTLSYEAFDGYNWLIYNDFIEAKTMFHTISYITALGRAQLWKKCMECKKIDPECKILRLDTDGVTVYCNKTLDNHLRETANNELGGWDYETHEAAYVRGLKKYALDNKVVFNGVNSKLKENLSMLHLTNEFLITDNEKWIQRRDFGWENKTRSIKMSKEYDKGKILDNGDVVPLLYSEIKSRNLSVALDREFLFED